MGADTTFTLALGFGSSRSDAAANARASLAAGFTPIRQKYAEGWHAYLATLKHAPNSITSNNLTTQYNVALMALKAHEDKTYRGANIASLTIPWGQAKSADACCVAGYWNPAGLQMNKIDPTHWTVILDLVALATPLDKLRRQSE